VADLMKLTADEIEALKSLDKKYEIIRTHTLTVAAGGSSGFLCWGGGGGGKSFQILKALRELGKEPGKGLTLINTKLTGPKLCKILEADPTGLFLVEDLEDIFIERVVLNLLRSAFWGQEGPDGKMIRPITYQTGNDNWNFDFNFEGAIIATCNAALDDIPELRALRTRIDIYHMDGEREELFAMAHQIALKGYRDVTPALAVQMWDFWTKHWPENRQPDLRMLPRMYRKYPHLADLKLKLTWEEILQSMIDEGDGEPVDTPSEARSFRLQVALELRRKYGTNLTLILPEWTQRTGLSTKQSYYNALNVVNGRR